jgi:uncharacterized protein (DUF1330 family)
MPKAYVVAELVITDPSTYETYRQQVLPTLQAFEGVFLVRGGTRIQYEGKDEAHHDQTRTVIVEFPSLQKARDWYTSPTYTEVKALRLAASEARLFIVEGA